MIAPVNVVTPALFMTVSELPIIAGDGKYGTPVLVSQNGKVPCGSGTLVGRRIVTVVGPASTAWSWKTEPDVVIVKGAPDA